MALQEMLKGESKNVEYKVELPKNSKKYVKIVIALLMRFLIAVHHRLFQTLHSGQLKMLQ